MRHLTSLYAKGGTTWRWLASLKGYMFPQTVWQELENLFGDQMRRDVELFAYGHALPLPLSPEKKRPITVYGLVGIRYTGCHATHWPHVWCITDTTICDLHIVYHQKACRVPYEWIYPCVEPRVHSKQRIDVESSVPCSWIQDKSVLSKSVKSFNKRIAKTLLFNDL